MTIQEMLQQVAEKARAAVAWAEGELAKYAEADEKDRQELADIDAMRREVEQRIAEREQLRATMAADAEQARRTLDAATRPAMPPASPAPLVPGPLSPIASQAMSAVTSTPPQGTPVVRVAEPGRTVADGVDCRWCDRGIVHQDEVWVHTRTGRPECPPADPTRTTDDPLLVQGAAVASSQGGAE